MMVKMATSLACLAAVLWGYGGVNAYIGFEDKLTPGDNCSEAYIQLQREHFGCINGSLAYCSRGMEDFRQDITEVCKNFFDLSMVL